WPEMENTLVSRNFRRSVLLPLALFRSGRALIFARPLPGGLHHPPAAVYHSGYRLPHLRHPAHPVRSHHAVVTAGRVFREGSAGEQHAADGQSGEKFGTSCHDKLTPFTLGNRLVGLLAFAVELPILAAGSVSLRRPSNRP